MLSWKPIDAILLYASYSKGYKAGGFNLDRSALTRQTVVSGVYRSQHCGRRSPARPAARDLLFDPEINDAFELGLKYDGPGIDINLALFRQDFKDFQLNTFNGINFEVENVNSCSELNVANGDTDVSAATGACVGQAAVGRAVDRPRGRDLHAAVPQRQLQSRRDLREHPLSRQSGRGERRAAVARTVPAVRTRNVSDASELVTTASFAWTPPIGSSGMRGLFYIDGRQMSDFNTGSDLDVEKRQKGFGVINGRIGLHGPDDRWGVELWAQNLLDTKFKQVAFDMPLQGGCTERGALNGFCGVLANYGIPTRSQQLFGAFLGEPRTFGLTIRGKLGAPARAPMVEEALRRRRRRRRKRRPARTGR